MGRNILFVIIGVASLTMAYALADSFPVLTAAVLTARDVWFPQPKEIPLPDSVTMPLTGFAKTFSNSLMTVDGDGTPHSLDTHRLNSVRYWAFYYSASWCPPCRAFTPDLVNFYRDFKPSHPDFELIFVNDDRNEEDMLNYMKNDSMPWPAIWYADINNPELEAKKYCGPGIPCLVLVDASGQVISDTFQNGQYTDPHHVIDDIGAAVK